MDTATADRLTKKYPLGELLCEGKTKKVYEVKNNQNLAILVSKDDITAGDGAKHNVIPGKGMFANETTCNVFRLLAACELPVAFIEQDSANSFVAPACTMLPYEVVVRREAHGSYCKRYPSVPKGQFYPQLLVEFFLKTSGKKWRVHELPCDDPLLYHDVARQEVRLYHPAQPMYAQQPFLSLHEMDVFGQQNEYTYFSDMRRIAQKAFLILEKAWQLGGGNLVDFKVEFGLDQSGCLFLADVIDNDAWRVLENGLHIDKQIYRDGGALADVLASYKKATEITQRFHVPQQQIILWRGSEKDDLSPFFKILDTWLKLAVTVTCSMHKEPERGVTTLHNLTHAVPDSVVIAYIGKSNGAGPTLSALTTVPVLTVPALLKDFPDDLWSSVRAPYGAPVATILEAGNAVLAALNILSARNPAIYAYLRAAIEPRLVNPFQNGAVY